MNGRAVGQYGIHAPLPGIPEVEWLLDKEVDLGTRMLGTPKRKDRESFVFDPGASHLLSCEVAQRHGRSRLVLETFESSDRGQCVGFVEIEHEIEVCREPRMAMKHDGHATYDEVPNLGHVEGTKYLGECVVRHVPIVSWRRLGAALSAPPPRIAASQAARLSWRRYAAITASIGSLNSTGQRCAYPAPATNHVTARRSPPRTSTSFIAGAPKT